MRLPARGDRCACENTMVAPKIAFLILIGIPAAAQQTARPPVEEAVAPAYPALAVIGRISGRVVVSVRVSQQGAVTEATSDEGDPMLREAGLQAARLWRFGGTVSGQEVKLNFIFRLMPKATPEPELGAIFRPPYTVEVRRITPGPVHHYARAARPEPDRRPD